MITSSIGFNKENVKTNATQRIPVVHININNAR